MTYALLGWDERTTFASGYDEARFKSIAPVASLDEVESRLGAPLSA